MFISVVLLWLFFCFILFQLKSQRPKNFPPGPIALPLLGNLLHLNLANPLEDFERLRRSYGNIYSLFIGPRPVVVLNGVKAIREAMVLKSQDFAGRPQDLLFNDLTEGKGVIFVDYGPNWREHRRFALMTLKNFGLGKTSMEERINKEICHAIKTLEESFGKTLNPEVMFFNIASNIVCQVLFNTRYEYEDQFIKVIISCFGETLKIVNGPWGFLYDSYPSIRKLPLPFKKAFKNYQTVKDLVSPLLVEHKESRVPGDPRDFIDCYLDEMEKNKEHSMFSDEQLLMYMLDIHGAGTDTTSNTLLTAFFYLVTHQHVQEKCQQEIDQVMGEKDEISFEDRNDMPYMQAVIHEVQRVANIVPLSVFHCATKDTDLLGYSIPKGTNVLVNMASALNEEEHWKFPHEFNPGNFLDEQGKFTKPVAFMPFSAGPRVCPGEGLARMELFLVMVTLLRKYTFTWPEDAREPDFTPIYGFTMAPKPYRMKVQVRTMH